MTAMKLAVRRWLVLASVLACLAGFSRDGSGVPARIPTPAEYGFSLADGQTSAEFTFSAAVSKQVWILVEGLQHGGFVRVRINGLPPDSVELRAVGGLAQGRAGSVLIRASAQQGENQLLLAELDGVQMVRIPQTMTWFATSSDSGGKPRFSVNLGHMGGRYLNQYPVAVYYGQENSGFLRFTGFFDQYYGEIFSSGVTDIAGNSGVDDAGLTYVLHYPARGLLMPTRIKLVRSELPDNFSLRVWQRIQAAETPTFDDLSNVQFLHVVAPDAGGLDWGDGEPDWAWHRAQDADNPDVLPGSHVAICNIDDNSDKVSSYRASTSDPTKRTQSSAHHTGGAASMETENSIGGWFTRNGSGCVGLVFHRYRATFRDDLRPVFSHCGDGADTHFYLFCGELFGPLGMKRGDEIEIRYSLFFLPAEPQVSDICSLNDMDLQVFGAEPQQQTPITAWVATKEVLGLQREDGSLILWGLGGGSTPRRFPITAAVAEKVQRVSRFVSPDQPEVEELKVTEGAVSVLPGTFTLLDCGAVLHPPTLPPKK
jgi:hypothetical protein